VIDPAQACDGVAKADVVELHLDPCGETTKTRAAIVRGLDGKSWFQG